MKHHFQFIFAAALLLGSLILLNKQSSESPGQLVEHPHIDQVELLAEMPANGSSESPAQSNRLHTENEYTSISSKTRLLESISSTDHRLIMKQQLQIHLEMRPLIAMHSGPMLLHRPGHGDPPVS